MKPADSSWRQFTTFMPSRAAPAITSIIGPATTPKIVSMPAAASCLAVSCPPFHSGMGPPGWATILGARGRLRRVVGDGDNRGMGGKRCRGAVAAVGLLAGAASAASAEVGGTIGPLDWSLRDGLVYEDASRDLRVDLDGRFAVDWVHWDDRNARSTQLRFDRALLGVSARLNRYQERPRGLRPRRHRHPRQPLGGLDLGLAGALGAGLGGPPARRLLPRTDPRRGGEPAARLPGLPRLPDEPPRLGGAPRRGDRGRPALLRARRRPGRGLRPARPGPRRPDDRRAPDGPPAALPRPQRSSWAPTRSRSSPVGSRASPTPSPPTTTATSTSPHRCATSSSTPVASTGTVRDSGCSATASTWGRCAPSTKSRAAASTTCASPAACARTSTTRSPAGRPSSPGASPGSPTTRVPSGDATRCAPTRPPDRMDGEGDDRGIGTIELAFRYANADIDRDFFTTGLTSATRLLPGVPPGDDRPELVSDGLAAALGPGRAHPGRRATAGVRQPRPRHLGALPRGVDLLGVAGRPEHRQADLFRHLPERDLDAHADLHVLGRRSRPGFVNMWKPSSSSTIATV